MPKAARIHLILSVSIAILVTVYGFFANEASKEVYYLCGNFKQGDKLASVVRQLDTTHLSSYTIKQVAKQQKISFSSGINFHWASCKIQFDNNGLVQSVTYQ